MSHSEYSMNDTSTLQILKKQLEHIPDRIQATPTDLSKKVEEMLIEHDRKRQSPSP